MSLVKNLALQVLTLLKHLWALVCDLSGFSRGLLAIIRFEIKRVTTPGRAFWWVFVAIFPIVIACLLRYVVEPQVRENIQNAVIHQQMTIEQNQNQNQNQQIIVPATSGDQSGMGQLPPGAQFQPGQAQPMAAPPPIGSNRDQLYTVALYLLGPSIACMLGALLIAAPAIASELEQHSWIYLATRPNGVVLPRCGQVHCGSHVGLLRHSDWCHRRSNDLWPGVQLSLKHYRPTEATTVPVSAEFQCGSGR